MSSSSACPLVCPRCRHVDGEGNLQLRSLAPSGALLRCECGARYPVVDGVPIVLRDVPAWALSEGLDALRIDADPEVLDLLLPPGSAAARNRELARVYAASPASPLTEWWDDVMSRQDGLVLELGAARGHASTVRLDTNHRLLRQRRAVPPQWTGDYGGAAVLRPGAAVCADALDPPFPPACFDAVALVNLLDSCRDPFLALAQADALVRPGGALILSCAFAFGEGTPPDRRFDETDLVRALSGEAEFGGYALDARIEALRESLEWRLALAPRTTHVHHALALVARKPR